jgi:hypothetical protein
LNFLTPAFEKNSKNISLRSNIRRNISILLRRSFYMLMRSFKELFLKQYETNCKNFNLRKLQIWANPNQKNFFFLNLFTPSISLILRSFKGKSENLGV